MPTIAVAGALANKPLNGGEAWVRMSWVEAFRRLGAEVLFVEQLADATCVDEHGRPAPFGGSLNKHWFNGVVERFGLCHGAALVHAGGCAVHGLDRTQLHERLSGADLLVNISGHLTLPELT